MSDWFYKFVVTVCRPAFTVSSCPVVLHRDRVARPGAYLMVPTHLSAFDVPCLMAVAPRPLDFLSITELFAKPLVRWFFTNMNVFALNRAKPDAGTMRIILDRLSRGRAVCMFPEGHIRNESNSVLSGGEIKPGVAAIAYKSGAPVIPCVILGTKAYHHHAAWLPLRRTRYGVIYGEPIYARTDLPEAEARSDFLAELKRRYRLLHAELLQAMSEKQRGDWQRVVDPPPQGVPAGSE